MFFSRPDGVRINDPGALRVIMPYVMPKRNESVAYFEDEIDLSETDSYLETSGSTTSLFHLTIAAMIKTLAERKELNRFVHGKRLYQRSGIVISFAVKKRFADEAPISTVKLEFSGSEGIAKIREKIDASIGTGRAEAPTQSEREMNWFARLPRPVNEVIFLLYRLLDYFNLIPRAMIASDPLYASAMIANIGSLGMNAPYHHLYEWGTISLFITMGKIVERTTIDKTGTVTIGKFLPLRFAFDERICDGYYCAKSLQLFKELLEKPALWTR